MTLGVCPLAARGNGGAPLREDVVPCPAEIFATLTEDGRHLHVLVDEGETRAAVAEDPSIYEELWWGRRLSGVRVDLATAPAERVAELLEEAWRRRAPKKLVAELDRRR